MGIYFIGLKTYLGNALALNLDKKGVIVLFDERDEQIGLKVFSQVDGWTWFVHKATYIAIDDVFL